jgi:hypothetical protein
MKILTVEQRRQRDREWYAQNRDKILAQKARYRKEHRDRLLECQKKRRDANPEPFRRRSREYHHAHRQERLLAMREWKRKKVYGLSPELFEEMFQKQGYSCAICKKNISNSTRNQHVDHDHATGKVRGILCSCCNVGIGQFEDDIRRMELAISYIKSHR